MQKTSGSGSASSIARPMEEIIGVVTPRTVIVANNDGEANLGNMGTNKCDIQMSSRL